MAALIFDASLPAAMLLAATLSKQVNEKDSKYTHLSTESGSTTIWRSLSASLSAARIRDAFGCRLPGLASELDSDKDIAAPRMSADDRVRIEEATLVSEVETLNATDDCEVHV